MNSGGEASPRAWKGLDTSRKPVFLGYDQIERMLAALLDTAAKWRPDEVVGIARGGLVPAAMAAGILALPLSFIRHDKSTGAISWIGAPASGRRILLVDDCCSTGQTLYLARQAMLDEGRACLTLVVVHDPDVVQHVPDLSHPMRDLFRLPWERGEATPTGRAAKASGTNLDHSAEAPFTGLGFNDELLAKIADREGELPHQGPPSPLALPRERLSTPPTDRAALISARPPSDRARISAMLAATPYRHLPLEYPPEPIADDAMSVARFKAEAATRIGCTHFIECDAQQAIVIAAWAPHLIVTWWSVEAGRGWTIGAARKPKEWTAPDDFRPT